MARGEVTGRKPLVTADPTKRKPGPPIADPGAVEPTAHVEPQRSASAPKPPIRGPPLAMSIREFCTAHRISEDMFFKKIGRASCRERVEISRYAGKSTTRSDIGES